MSDLGQRTLIQSLTDADSLEYLATIGFDDQIIPSETLRPLYVFAIDYWYRNGRLKAPTEAVMLQTFEDILSDEDIVLEEPEESIEWAVEDLQGSYATARGQVFLRKLAADLAESESGEKVDILSEAADELMRLSHVLENKSRVVDIREGIEDRVRAYEARVAAKGQRFGFPFGIPAMDTYTGHLHPGELAVIAAGPKVGKSLFLAKIAYEAWLLGYTPVLFTLENSVEMTQDRIACMAACVDSRRWQHGECTPQEIEKVMEKLKEIQGKDHPLWILQPDLGKRSFERMVREGELRGADGILIDQLTFVELPSAKRARHEQIGEGLHTLKGMISTGHSRIPTILAHQINREGVKASEKADKLEMYHLAESAEVERTADFVFGLFRNESMKATSQAMIQTLAVRRDKPKNWMAAWLPDTGVFDPNREVTI